MSDFNPLKLIEDAIKAGFDPGAVNEIDDNEMTWAKNCLSWVVDSQFLDTKTIFPAQAQVMLKLFGDVCMYCSDRDFHSKEFTVDLTLDLIRERTVLMEDGRCPECSKSRLDQYLDGLWKFPDEINLLWGMRSGKSAVAGGLIGSYVLHRYLRLPEPAVSFGLLKGQEIYMRFAAMTMRQAKQSNWMHFARAIATSPWYKQYHDFMEYHSHKKGVQYVHWLNENFAYVHKGIVGYCVGSSNDRERGRTAAFSSIDEIGLFNPDENARDENAPETYATYQQASATVRSAAYSRFLAGEYNIPTAWMTVQSSTMTKTDYIVKLIKQNKNDPTKVTSHKASWEINPDLTESFLLGQKRKDPKKFNRDFGSIPPFADDPFIDNEEAVVKTAKLAPPDWKVSFEVSTIGPYLSAENVLKNKGVPYCLAIDMGRTDCGYTLALLQLKEDDFTTVQVAGLWGVYPQPGESVDFDGMFNKFILILCDRLNIRLVLYDTWQSGYQVDALVKAGVKAEQYTLTYKDFILFRSSIYQEKLETIQPEMGFADVETSSLDLKDVLYSKPYIHLLWQILSVKETGTKITKGDGHDDLFRAVALGVTVMLQDKYRPQFEYRKGMTTRFNTEAKRSLALAGGSRSGNVSYQNQAGSASGVVTANNRVLGMFIPRTKR